MATPPSGPVGAAGRGPRRWWVLAVVLALVAGVSTVAIILLTRPPAAEPVARAAAVDSSRLTAAASSSTADDAPTGATSTTGRTPSPAPTSATAPASSPTEPETLLIGISTPDVDRWDAADEIVVSTDGDSWETVHSPGTPLWSIGVSADLSVVTGTDGLFRSVNGREWEIVIDAPSLSDVVEVDGTWWGVSGVAENSDTFDFTVWRSDDGARTWSSAEQSVPSEFGGSVGAARITHHDGTWTVVGAGFLGDSVVYSYATSTDGTSWSAAPEPVLENGWGNHVFPGTSNGAVQVSLTNLLNDFQLNAGHWRSAAAWLPASGGPWTSTPLAQELVLTGLQCTGRGWLSAGGPFTVPDGMNRVFSRTPGAWTSPDLVNWTSLGTPSAALERVAEFPAVAPTTQRCGVPTDPGAAAPDAAAPQPAPAQSDPQPDGDAADLGLTRPITRPACDGAVAVFLGAEVDPSLYSTTIQGLLDRYPEASYLRTDQSCPSLTQASADGTAIYAVFVLTTADQACAVVASYGDDAYARRLDNSSPATSLVEC